MSGAGHAQMQGVVVVEKSLSSSLSASIFRVRLTVLRVGFKFKLAMSRMRAPAPSRLLLGLLAGYGVQSAMALPQNGTVAAGGVTIGTPANNTLNITQTTDKGIINWGSFNVGAGEKVNFQQPSATSSTLNRIVGSDASQIFGQINANGQVFLVNPNGILFAPGSSVNAGGLIASTLALSDANYLSGNYVFAGNGGSVDNQGDIKAGFAVLAGQQVSNTGSIVADGGTVGLAAGGRVTLNLTGSDVVSMSVDAPTAQALVHSGGIVQADGGQVLISAKAANALLDTVVNVDGIVRARAISNHGGVITLDGGDSGVVAVTGTLDASGRGAGQTGGTVKVLGEEVALAQGGTIDASGDAGGGVVRVGGDWHGAGADGDANASQVYVSASGKVLADAVTIGNGGDVVLWSNDATSFLGKVSARGGSLGGDGGRLETSSHGLLGVDGRVDLSAPGGTAGYWLLDPGSITISSASSTFTDSGGDPDIWRTTSHTYTLKSSDLAGSFQSAGEVDVRSNTINVNDLVSVTALSNTATGILRLQSTGDIKFNGSGGITHIANGTGGSAKSTTRQALSAN